MTTVEEIEKWLHALHQFEKKSYTHAIVEFSNLKATSKIEFNLGCCHLICGDKNTAIQKFKESLSIDPHFALPWFLLGQIHFESNRLQNARHSYEEAKKSLRGNVSIDYRKLGCKFVLHISEILINQVLINYELGEIKEAEHLLIKAEKLCMGEKIWSEISNLCQQLKSGIFVELLKYPLEELFRPDQRNVKNIAKKNFLGEAKVISTENEEEIYACFSGLKLSKNQDHKNHAKEPIVEHLTNQPKAKPRIPPYSPALRKKLSISSDSSTANSNSITDSNTLQCASNPIVKTPRPVKRPNNSLVNNFDKKNHSVPHHTQNDIKPVPRKTSLPDHIVASKKEVKSPVIVPRKQSEPPNPLMHQISVPSLYPSSTSPLTIKKSVNIPPKPPKKSPKMTPSPLLKPKPNVISKPEIESFDDSNFYEIVDDEPRQTQKITDNKHRLFNERPVVTKSKKPARPPPPSVLSKKDHPISAIELKRLMKLKPCKPLPRLPK